MQSAKTALTRTRGPGRSLRKTGLTSRLVLHALFMSMVISFVIPLIAILSISLSGEQDIITSGYSLFPRRIDLTAYTYIFRKPELIIRSYKVTILVTAISTVLYLVMISLCAYPLSRPDFKYRKGITFYLFFTMLFNGGLVPSYILMTRYLGLKNTYAALILPLLGNVWYLFLMRTFFQQIPRAVIESAIIDGAGEFLVYARIILPLSKPVLATVGLFQLLNGWNSWYPSLLYISKQSLYPLQYLLQVMLRSADTILKSAAMGVGVIDSSQLAKLPTESMRMAMCLLAIGPILLVFPFFQKYFTKGLTVGAVKG